jgi:hypothetical protein
MVRKLSSVLLVVFALSSGGLLGCSDADDVIEPGPAAGAGGAGGTAGGGGKAGSAAGKGGTGEDAGNEEDDAGEADEE